MGTGQMGSGITALLLATAEVSEVIWWGRSDTHEETANRKLNRDLRRYGKLNSIEPEQMYGKLKLVNDFESVDSVSFCIEAISEHFDEKASLLGFVSEKLPEDCVLATNTSSFSITALSMHTFHPDKLIGMHFFNPTSVMELIEVVKGLNTSEEIIEKTVKLANLLNKKPIVVNESPGFVVNRMLIPMINEAIAILAENVASELDIDQAMKLGAHHPLGPLALADLIGNDVCLSIMETLHYETGDPKYRAHSLLRQYVRAGWLGRKTKKGFYDY
ncbi:3-hydroxyacyl-CoA dehydrogenase NAD-binding domain-containing protein [Vibrio pectenicida]|uniref:3-hydroxyacyl-CoA dehydrogenase NAD-binding domain-containing protein n=1 Tax=Vibrio pectenicida TaxID=62763 RepID=UPI0030815622